MEKAKLPDGVSQEMIDAWKTKYGEGKVELMKLKLDDPRNETLDVIARHPDRIVVGEYMRFTKDNPDKANTILVNNLILAGKEKVLADVDFFLTAVAELSGMINIGTAERVKL